MGHALIFDLDGTLWGPIAAFVPAWNEILAEKIGPGCEVTASDVKRIMGLPINEVSKLILPNTSLQEAIPILQECFERHTEYLKRSGGTLYPYVSQGLKELGSCYDLYCVSNCTLNYMKTFMDGSSIGSYFKDWECIGRTGQDKAENIQLLMARNKVTSATYVGDTERDAREAEKAGVDFIFVSYGYGTLEGNCLAFNDFRSLVRHFLTTALS